MRRYKALGVALAAVLALSALAAQVASASLITVTGGESGSTFYTGDQDSGAWEFKDAGGLAAKCTTSSIFGSSSGATVSETTWSNTYSGCTGFGFATMHWFDQGCTYTFTTPTKIKAGEVTWHASDIHIVCPAGKKIEYTPTTFGASVCTRFLSSQTPAGGHVVGKNVTVGGTEMAVTWEITLTGLRYTGTGSVCGNSEIHTDLNWQGNSLIRAYSNGGHSSPRGITFS